MNAGVVCRRCGTRITGGDAEALSEAMHDHSRQHPPFATDEDFELR